MTIATAPQRVLVTGAGGFIGRRLCDELTRRGVPVRRALRAVPPEPQSGRAYSAGTTDDTRIAVGDIGPDTDWSTALQGVSHVVHLAARAHQLRDPAPDRLAAFRHVNVAGTQQLLRQSLNAGVQRLVFVSSIGVNGAQTFGQPYRASDPPAPHSPYAVSKLEAERLLAEGARATSLQLVVVRPPLVLGPDAPGNFGQLLRGLRAGWPLPLASVRNQRSFIGVDNLVDLLILCLTHPQAAGRTFLVGENEDLSTPELLRRMAVAMQCHARLLPAPVAVLRALATLAGRPQTAQSLFDSLQVDSSETRRILDWSPPLSMDEVLRRATQRTPIPPSMSDAAS